MEKIIQLWGSPPRNLNSFIKKKIINGIRLAIAVQAKAVIVGQTCDYDFQRLLVDMAHNSGIRVFLWAPLFSEFRGLKAPYPYIDANYKMLQRKIIDEFYFCCPSNSANIEKFFIQQDETMNSVPFDGVFLDRMRYPSLSQGGLQILGCFCNTCTKIYKKHFLDLDYIRHLLLYPKGENPLALSKFIDGAYVCADDEINAFLSLRAKIITEAVRKIQNHYEMIQKTVALDLFPPQWAYLVGQNIRDLLPIGEFVKPMIYNSTTAPAGIQYERDAYSRTVGPLTIPDSLVGGETHDERLINEISSFEQVRERYFPKKDIFWGVDVCKIKHIVNATQQSIRDTKEKVKSAGGHQICLSWNVINTSQINLLAFCNEET